MRPFAIYTQEMHAHKDDISFHENSARMHANAIQETAPVGHVSKSMVVSPDQFGWPLCGNRMLTCSCSQESLVWVGPDSFEAEFTSLFFRLVVRDGDVFIRDDDHTMRSAYFRMAKLRAASLPDKFDYDKLDLEMLLAPGAVNRYNTYMSHRESMQGVFNAYLFDVEQNVRQNSGEGFKPNSFAGSFMPTLITHGTIVSASRRRIAGVGARFAAMGIPFLKCLSYNFGAPHINALYKLSDQNAKRVTGNGMHRHAIACWWAYCLSNLVRRDQMLDMQPVQEFQLSRKATRSREKLDDCKRQRRSSPQHA